MDRPGSTVLEFILVAVIWYIWWERRQLVHGEELQMPTGLANVNWGDINKLL